MNQLTLDKLINLTLNQLIIFTQFNHNTFLKVKKYCMKVEFVAYFLGINWYTIVFLFLPHFLFSRRGFFLKVSSLMNMSNYSIVFFYFDLNWATLLFFIHKFRIELQFEYGHFLQSWSKILY